MLPALDSTYIHCTPHYVRHTLIETRWSTVSGTTLLTLEDSAFLAIKHISFHFHRRKSELNLMVSMK